MQKSYLLQSSGSTALVVALAIADLAARLLNHYPTSELLWFIQIDVLRPLSALRMSDSAFTFLFGSNTLPIAGSGLALIWTFHVLRARLLIALFANLSSLIVAEVVFRWGVGVDAKAIASLGGGGALIGYDALLMTVLGTVSLIGFFASHITFLRQINLHAR